MPTDTATVLFTDLVGSTEMRQRLGDDRADELRRVHDALITRSSTANDGRVVKGLGDGFLITFPAAASGIAAAVAIQQALEQHNRTATDELAVRIGLSVGDVTWEDDDCFGTPVIEASRLVEETGADRYRFAHALVRSTLYDETSATRRARLHRRVAAYLEDQRPDDVAALAYHYGQSTAPIDAGKAVDYAIRAGDEAMQQLAHDQALQYFASTLEHLDSADSEDAVRRAAVMLGLGKAQRYSGDASYRATLLAAADIAHEAGLVDIEADAVLANSRGFWSAAGTLDSDRIMRIERAERCIGDGSSPARRARLLGLLATELMFAGDNDRRQACMQEAITLARAVDDEATLAAVLALSVPSRFLPWTTGEGLADARELVDLAARLADPSLQVIAGVWLYTMVMMAEDDVSTGQAELRQAAILADELGQPLLRWIGASWRGLKESHRGDVNAVERSAGEAFELGTGSGQPDAATWFYGQSWWVAFARDQLAAVTELVEAEVTNNPGLPAWKAALSVTYAVTGRVAEARVLLAEFAHDGRVEVPRDVLWLGTHTQLAWVAAEIGDDEVAALLYDALLPYRSLRSHSGVFVLAPVELYLGRLARCLGRNQEAVEHLAAAVSRARSDASWFALSLSLSALAEASHATGAADDRRSMLDEALEVARRCPSAYAERLAERARAAIS